jgi:hypothetical protein
MIVAASTTLLADSRSGGRGGVLPWALLVIGSVASLVANVAVAEPTVTGRIIAAGPSFALIGSYELLMRQVRRTAAGYWLLEDKPGREDALTLARRCLDILDGVTPLDERRQALIALHDRLAAAGWPGPEITSGGTGQVQAAWAGAAGSAELAALPELAGPEGYLAWAYDGFAAAHQRLAAAVPAVPPLAQATAGLTLAAGLTAVPGALAAATGSDAYLGIQDRATAISSDGFSPVAWREDARGWLSRGLAAGEISACRGWLDMAVRLTSLFQGLPGEPVMASPCYVPVAGFQRDVRAYARPSLPVVILSMRGRSSSPRWKVG